MSIIKSIRKGIREWVLKNVPTMVSIDDYAIVRVLSISECVGADISKEWEKKIALAVEHLKIQVPNGFRGKGQIIEVLLYEREREALRKLMGFWVGYLTQKYENHKGYENVINDCKRIIEVL